jgi:hypothetical protein
MTSLSTAYIVAPTGVNALAPPTMVNTSTSAAVGNGLTNIVTSPTLPAGTYFVGGIFAVISTTTFSGSDTVFFEITDTAGSLTVYPLTGLAGNNGIGSTPSAMSVTVSGVLVLAVSGTLSWGMTCDFNNAANKTGFVGNAFYQRIA